MLSFECIKWSIQGVQYPWSCQFNTPRNCVPILLWENSSKDVSQSQLEWKWWRMWDQGHKRLDSQEPNSVTNGFGGGRLQSQHLPLFPIMMDSDGCCCRESTPFSLHRDDGFWLRPMLLWLRRLLSASPLRRNLPGIPFVDSCDRKHVLVIKGNVTTMVDNGCPGIHP